ncbi:hypothetical protein CPB83DRAFT_807813 [Crepidotus variabilis]|uniref:Uncharacterized protein n=1 Tax=Crepidotus variabilis TaxID=179855 RepID=A0A9P6EPA2_9AGAR|nr:hypothetical protein CPB83DRAFT_807813 [Crepidotus variabilis]
MSSSFSATPAELTLVSQLFAKADPQKLGVLTGDVAVRIFGGAKLAPITLGEIWNIADEDNHGWLSKKNVAVAVRLIGWAQKGEKLSKSLLNKPGPLAVIEGINTVAQNNTGVSSPRSPPPQNFPVLAIQDRSKFQTMFIKAGAVNGILSGDKARDLFLKSKLPHEQLMKIWNLADTQDRGALDVADFTIGMYFIQGVMSGAISFVPNTLPPGLYQQAGGISNAPSVHSHNTGASGSFSPVRSGFVSAQLTGQSPMLQAHNTGTPFTAPALPARPGAFSHTNGHPHDWDVTQEEKSSADRFFDTLDTQKRGYIEGDIAVPFMLKSQLPGEVLAQVWDLADIHNDGRLTREGFAIAMHLIQRKLVGQEIPASLPPSLIPPSLRPSATAQSPFSSAPLHTQPEADLFSFDAFDDPPPAVQVHSTGSGMLQQQLTGSTTKNLTKPPIPQKAPVLSDPFAVPFSDSNHDFLGDDGAASPHLHDQSAEIGNVQNQLRSTEKSLSSAKQERQTLEKDLADQAAQLSTLQTQLSSAKAAYETETSLLNTLKERRTAQLADIQKTKEDLIRAESDLSAVRVEKSEIEGAFLRDKEEARDLHKRMVDAGQQADTMKLDMEKLRKEAKQQKGLLAIARKQLSTKEAERSKIQKEHEDALAEVTSLTEAQNAVDETLASLESPVSKAALSPSSDSIMFAAAQPLPVTPDLSQPTRNNSNNPFERLAMSPGVSTPRSQSPFLGLQNSIISSPPLSMNGATPFDHTSDPAHEEAIAEKTSLAISTDGADPDLSHLQPSPPAAPEGIFSPNTDHFMTPPSSASPRDSVEVNGVDSSISKFPAIEALSTPQLPSRDDANPSTDFGSGLKELEIEESDSSDDDSDDNQPLATLPAAKGLVAPITNGKAKEPPKEDIMASTTLPPLQVAPADVSFDDIFGSSAETQEAKKSEAPDFGNPPHFDFAQPTTELVKKSDEALKVAGVNEFDQTLTKSAVSDKAGATDFSFDDAFDENFDFASAKIDIPTSSASAIPATAAPERKEPSQTSAFEDIFGSSSTTSAATAPTQISSPVSTTSNGHTVDSSFDAVFAGFGNDSSAITEEKASPFAVPPQPIPATPPVQSSIQATSPSRDSNEGSIPGAFPIKASPVSSPTRSEAKSSLSKRGKSPPPRMASPKPRASSSSSKEAPDKPKDPPTRVSKLSQLRLPFGKKKKQQEPMPPPPSQLLTPPMEESGRVRTPGGEDDVEPVKQLTAMGFSRGQAVEALEKYDYDVQRALNSLLGAR